VIQPGSFAYHTRKVQFIPKRPDGLGFNKGRRR